MSSCSEFRARLEHVLSGVPGGAGLVELSWHRHLHECAECRAMLEREEALDVLLESLPEPALPPDLVQRVLRVLARARAAELRLDELLLLDRDPTPPPELGRQVLAAVAGARDQDELDALLGCLPEPRPPAGLAERVLERAAAERVRPRPRALPLERLAVAAAVVAAVGAWIGFGRGGAPANPAGGGSGEPPGGAELAQARDPALEAEPPADILVSLPVLENWEILRGDDLDLLLAAIETGDDDPLSAWEGETEGGPR